MILEFLPHHPKPPAGGGHFYVAHQQAFRGSTPQEVVRKLTEFRQNNAMSLGDVTQEVAQFYLTHAPWWVREVEGVAANSDRQRVAEHTMSVWYGKFERLHPTDPLIAARLAVCAACPHCHRGSSEAETAYFVEAMNRASLLTGQLDVAAAGWCDAHLWLNQVGARLVEPLRLASQKIIQGCWLRANES